MSDEEFEQSDMPFFSVVNCIESAYSQSLFSLLAHQHYHILHLDGSKVVDKASLLLQTKNDLPPVDDLNPHNWDALADYLWNGLYDLKSNAVALVWTDAHRLAGSDLQDFLNAVRIFSDVSRQVARGEGGFPRPMTLLLFLVGDGNEYRSLASF